MLKNHLKRRENRLLEMGIFGRRGEGGGLGSTNCQLGDPENLKKKLPKKSFFFGLKSFEKLFGECFFHF